MSDWRRFSRLPDSPDYWRGVNHRIQRSVHTMDQLTVEPVRSLMPLAWTAIAAATVAVIASSLLPPAADTPVSLRSGLAPADPLAISWLEQSEPPSTAEVLVGQMTRSQ